MLTRLAGVAGPSRVEHFRKCVRVHRARLSDREPQTPRNNSSLANTRVGSGRQRAQQRELLLRERDRSATQPHLARRGIGL
jgi:hypothetical protein